MTSYQPEHNQRVVPHATTNQQIYNFPCKATTLKLNRHRFARLLNIPSTLIYVCTLNKALIHTISFIRKHATPTNTCSSTTIPNSLKFPINPPPRRYTTHSVIGLHVRTIFGIGKHPPIIRSLLQNVNKNAYEH